VSLSVNIQPGGMRYAGHPLDYAFDAHANGANLAGTTNPLPVTLTVGNDSSTTSVTAKIP
jgi:hypothetical protein